MTQDIVQEIRRLLVAFRSVQKRLFSIYAQKNRAMRTSNLEILNRSLVEENRCHIEFQNLMRVRKDLITRANPLAPGAKTLEELVELIGEEDRDELLGKVKILKTSTANLRSQSWGHWIIARRGFQHYSQILELIANSGKKSPTYERTNRHVHSGGAILDTSA